MLKIKIIIAGAAVAAASTVGAATIAHSQPAGADTTKAAATTKFAEPIPVGGAGAAADHSGKRTTEKQHVVTNIANKSGQGITLVEVSTRDDAPFSAKGGFHLPKAGDAVKDGAAYKYQNVVDAAAMNTSTTWKIGEGATVKLYEESTEAGVAWEITGPKAGDYTVKSSIGAGSGGGTDITDIEISKK